MMNEIDIKAFLVNWFSRSCIKVRIKESTMKTVALELPDALDARLEAAAGERKIDKAQLVRVALETYLAGDPAATMGPEVEAERKPVPGSCLERAGDLVGCLEGPGDLSTNPKYMEGFGE
jgi:hypothetical protein